MRKIIGFVAAILLVGTMIVLMIKSNADDKKARETINEAASGQVETDMQNSEGLEKGDTPPDFELSTLDGKVVKLSELKGKKVILNFWASWCGPCKAEMPHMQNYYQNLGDGDNVEIVAVNMTTQERRGLSGIEEFIEEYGLTFPIPLDENGEAIESYRVMTIPTTYMIGTDGTISQKIIGPMDEKTIVKLVENLD